MAWPYRERLWHGLTNILLAPIAWPHYARQWNGRTVSAAMAWSHEYLFPIPQSIVLSKPTYLLPDSSDRRPKFLPVLVGGGVVLEPRPPRALPPPLLFPSLPPE